MMKFSPWIRVILFFLYFLVGSAYGKFKILAIMPYNGKSHFYFAQVLLEELARRGHDVTVLSNFPRKTSLPNYYDISMARETRNDIHRIKIDDISKTWRLQTMAYVFSIGLHEVCEQGLSHPNVQKLLQSTEHYDVVITEMFNTDCFLGFVPKFGGVHVALRTGAVNTWSGDRTGSPINPSYVPTTITGYPSRMNFLQRLYNVWNYVSLRIIYKVYDTLCEQVARQHFGSDMPSLDEIARNTSLFLVNAHFLHQFARPLMPNVKEISGIHVREPKSLPKDLEDWISGARRGLVYLNLGSMLSPSSMSEEKRLAFLEAFAGLPQRVLMKWSEAGMEDLPDNVKLTTWAPQNDILHHPNVKLFISHAGMLGTVEAVHAGVPIIAIPFFGDQPTNAALIEERGLGVRLEYADITTDTLNRTLDQVLSDPRYAARAKQLSAAFRDRPIEPLEEAAYWVEYVARHKGLVEEGVVRSPAQELALHQYLLLDVLGAVFLAAWLLLRLFRTLVAALVRQPAKKTKTS